MSDKRLAEFYNYDRQFGAVFNDINESQYGIKDGIASDPSRYHFFYEILLTLIRQKIAADSVLLDIGCGAGIFAEVTHGKVKKYIGIDISDERIKQAEARNKYGNCSFEEQDAQHMTFPDISFDAAVAIEVIEHVPDTDSFLREVNRVMVKGGTLVLTTPANLFFKNKMEYLYKDQHIYEFSITRLKAILKKSGFSVKYVTGVGFKTPRIIIPVWLGSDIIKYAYKRIRNVKLNAGYGHPISLEFDIVSNKLINKMYFTRRYKSPAVTLMRIFGFIGSHFPIFSSNLVMVCKKAADNDSVIVNRYGGISGRIVRLAKESLPFLYETCIKLMVLKLEDIKRAPIIRAGIEKIMATKPFPLFRLVEVETINRCNNACSFCPVNKDDDTRPFKLMDDRLFRSIIEQLREMNYSGHLGLFSNNEPFLDSRICEFARIAKEALPGAYLVILTNGTLLTIDKLNALMKYVDLIEINNYDDSLKLIKPVREIYEYTQRNKIYQGKIKIYLRKKNEILMNRAGQAKNRRKIRPLRSSCGYPFTQLVIRPDGKASLCCNDALGQMTMGDLTKERIIDVWNGAIFRQTRRDLLEGRRCVRLCSLCDGYI